MSCNEYSRRFCTVNAEDRELNTTEGARAILEAGAGVGRSVPPHGKSCSVLFSALVEVACCNEIRFVVVGP